MALQRAEVLDSAYSRDRAFMVERHLKARGIDDPLLLEAMGTVPREAFVPEHLQEFVYEDSALPIESGQTISQPYIVARMIELLELAPGDKVLEVGAGSGYAAAVLSRVAREVYAIERHEELANEPALGYLITPQAMRAPAPPIGWVLWSSAAAWITRAEPSASGSAGRPLAFTAT